jgi:hypothetical protein
MKVRIHRGAKEVGGSCVEVAAGDSRIVLDIGRPLDALRDDAIPLPDIAGIDTPDETLLALTLSALASACPETAPLCRVGTLGRCPAVVWTGGTDRRRGCMDAVPGSLPVSLKAHVRTSVSAVYCGRDSCSSSFPSNSRRA